MDWAELLDDIEQRLADVERGLSTGQLGTSPFALPPGIGPMPAHLRERAERALDRTRAMEVEVEAARRWTAESLRRGRTPSRAPAAYLDTRI